MNRKQILLIGIITSLTLAGDQLSKWWARDRLCAERCTEKLTSIAWSYPCCRRTPPIVLIENYLQLEYHENPGAAFGLLRNIPGARFILVGVGIAALVLVWTMVRKVERARGVANVAFALVAGGALGNLLDRLYLGRVVDFTLMHWQHKHVWPAYNVADVALVVGVGLLVIVLGRKPEGAAARGKRKAKSSR